MGDTLLGKAARCGVLATVFIVFHLVWFKSVNEVLLNWVFTYLIFYIGNTLYELLDWFKNDERFLHGIRSIL